MCLETMISINVHHFHPGKRASWDFHGEQGWYIGPSTDHYRCITCYIPKSHKERINDTTPSIPSNIPIPQASLNDHLLKTSDDLVHLLHRNEAQFTPNAPLMIKSVLLDIAKILHRDITPSITPNAVPLSSNSSSISSEGVNNKEINQPSAIASSEGGAIVTEIFPIDDVFKATITPIDTLKTTPHPALYETRGVSNGTTQ